MPDHTTRFRLSLHGTRVILVLVDLKLSTYVLSVLDFGAAASPAG